MNPLGSAILQEAPEKTGLIGLIQRQCAIGTQQHKSGAQRPAIAKLQIGLVTLVKRGQRTLSRFSTKDD
jgi:hypothetical protein